MSRSFWQEKAPAAVLKHSVLTRYLEVFASKTASTARDRRVVYVDAFAGPGRYEDGDSASPALAIELAEKLANRPHRPANLDCMFIEKNYQEYQRLLQTVPPERALHGKAEDYVDTLLARADRQPLFMFVDPYGQPVPFDRLTRQILARPRGLGLATEVLLNFSIRALQRNSGRLGQRKQQEHARLVLERFDAAMGGSWWHDRGAMLSKESGATDQQRQSAERSIVNEYASRVKSVAGYEPVISPIWSQKWKSRPFFYLVLFTANKQGVYFYADALADAVDAYYRAVHMEGEELFDRPDVRRNRAVSTIQDNIKALIAECESFLVLDKTLDLLEGALGDGGRNELLRAIRQLGREGVIETDGDLKVAEVSQIRIVRGGATSLF